MFSRIDTVIVRVRDARQATAWYSATLGLSPVYDDAAEGLTVLGLDGTSLTLWQFKPDEVRSAPTGNSFPIFAVVDAAAAHAQLSARGVAVEPVQDGPGVRYFGFRDLDGNRLEACQVL
jgi:catechol 2,3-dioxygenase-like lactoylglutathione lyase family enzyme